MKPPVRGRWSAGAIVGASSEAGRQSPDATVTVRADDVWRMFYNALSADALRSRVMMEGEADLVAPLLRTRISRLNPAERRPAR